MAYFPLLEESNGLFPLLVGDIFPDMKLKDLKASNSVNRNIPKLSLVMKKIAVSAPFWLLSFTLYSMLCMLYIFFDEKCHVISEKQCVIKAACSAHVYS